MVPLLLLNGMLDDTMGSDPAQIEFEAHVLSHVPSDSGYLDGLQRRMLWFTGVPTLSRQHAPPGCGNTSGIPNAIQVSYVSQCTYSLHAVTIVLLLLDCWHCYWMVFSGCISLFQGTAGQYPVHLFVSLRATN